MINPKLAYLWTYRVHFCRNGESLGHSVSSQLVSLYLRPLVSLLAAGVGTPAKWELMILRFVVSFDWDILVIILLDGTLLGGMEQEFLQETVLAWGRVIHLDVCID